MFNQDSHLARTIIKKIATGAAFFSVIGISCLCIYGQRAGAAEMQTGDLSEIQGQPAEEADDETAALDGEASEGSPVESADGIVMLPEMEQDGTSEEPLEEKMPMGEIREDLVPKLPYEEAGLEEDDWRLLVVNHDHEIPEGYEAVTVKTYNWQEVDEWIADDLEEMIEDCKDEGYSPYICSGYRTSDKQVSLFEADVRKYRRQGYSEEEARYRTQQTVAIPGTSEHELGLAVDIVSTGNQRLERSQEDTGTQQWLMENCWRYGFILRYPEDKEDITGISYEPWHYRYVGREAAEYMHDHNLCLEEFMGMTEEEE